MYLVKTVLLSCVIVFSSIADDASERGVIEPCERLFDRGVESYLDEKYYGCVENLEAFLQLYKKTTKIQADCRIRCKQEAEDSDSLFPVDVENLRYYESMIQQTLCIIKCKNQMKENLRNCSIGLETRQLFDERKPYEYLHICYFQRQRLQDAASAAFTYLAKNPGNERMKINLRYYSSLPEVNKNEIINFEAQEFLSSFSQGSEAYDAHDWWAVIRYMEESVDTYLSELEECRALCEGSYDQGWFPEFTVSVANHYTYCLKCKRKCSYTMSMVNGEYQEDLLPSHFNFLQFAYFQINDMKLATEAVATYLLFYPTDPDMLDNKQFYTNLPKVYDEYFTPRLDIVRYIQREKYELKLLNYIEKQFVFEDELTKKTKDKFDHPGQKLENAEDVKEKEESNKTEDLKNDNKVTKDEVIEILDVKDNEINEEVDKVKSKDTVTQSNSNDSDTNEKKEMIKEEEIKNIVNIENAINNSEEVYKLKDNKEDEESNNNINTIPKGRKVLIKSEEELRGVNRFMSDGFANEDQCQSMIELARRFGLKGDGYARNVSPHSSMEDFYGVTVGRAALLTYFGSMSPEMLELYLSMTESAHRYMELYFNLPNKLYVTYTHLVCRSTVAGAPKNRTDFSHQVHADNCNLQSDGECPKELPSYYWRDYSAIIYLNENFEGGEFVFSNDSSAFVIQSMVKPKCGRMIGFSAGVENIHGVRAVLSGTRCAVAVWFTLDPKHQEFERILARRLLDQITTADADGYYDVVLNELKKYVTADMLPFLTH